MVNVHRQQVIHTVISRSNLSKHSLNALIGFVKFDLLSFVSFSHKLIAVNGVNARYVFVPVNVVFIVTLLWIIGYDVQHLRIPITKIAPY